MKEPPLLESRRASPIRARLCPGTRASGSDLIATIEDLRQITDAHRGALRESRQRLATQAKRLRTVLRERHRARLERESSNLREFYREAAETTLNAQLKSGRAALLEIALRLAGQVLGEELKHHPGSLAERLRTILRTLSDTDDRHMTVHCSPSAQGELASRLVREFPLVTVESSPGLSSSALHVCTPSGTIELDLMEELKQLGDTLRASLQLPQAQRTPLSEGTPC